MKKQTKQKSYKTTCTHGYSIFGERPPTLDTAAEYIIIAPSNFFPHCVIIQRADGNTFQGERNWIVPEHSLYL